MVKMTYLRAVKGCRDASGGAWANMAMSRTPVTRTRQRRTRLIQPLGTLPTILANLQNKFMGLLRENMKYDHVLVEMFDSLRRYSRSDASFNVHNCFPIILC